LSQVYSSLLHFFLLSYPTGFIPPYALNRLLSTISTPTPDAYKRASLYAFLTLFAHLSFAQCDLFVNFHSRRAYERTRGQLFCAVHWKALRRLDLAGHGPGNKRSENADGEEVKKEEQADLGKVVNIMQ
jgi:hypothetical protein